MFSMITRQPQHSSITLLKPREPYRSSRVIHLHHILHKENDLQARSLPSLGTHCDTTQDKTGTESSYVDTRHHICESYTKHKEQHQLFSPSLT